MYDRRISSQNTPLLFGNTSALYESDMVMVDHQTGSYWMQVSGQALVGTLAGERLTPLPSQTTTWELWREQYPHTVVLSRDTGFDRNYDYDPFTGLGEYFNEGGDFIFPVSENGRDPRLDPGEVVLGVEVEGQQWAYPIERIGNGVIEDRVGQDEDQPIVIFSSENGPTAAAFSAVVDEQLLTFRFEAESYRDNETNSFWSLSGIATEGEMAGTQLTPLPTRSTFWFSLISSFPDLNFYEPDS